MYSKKNVRNNILLFFIGTFSAGLLCILLHQYASMHLPLWLCFLFSLQWAVISMYLLLLLIESDCHKVRWLIRFIVLAVLLVLVSVFSISMNYVSSFAWLLPLIGLSIGNMLGIFVYACCFIASKADVESHYK